MSNHMHIDTAENASYPKPPYDDCEKVWHFFETPIDKQCAYRAMERDGAIFKTITHKVRGLKYIYWHPEKNGIELWHKREQVGAWANAIRMLDERFIFVALRSKQEDHELSDSSSDSDTETTSEHPHRSSEETDYDIVLSSESVDETKETSVNELDMSTTKMSETLQWATRLLTEFKSNAKYKILFDVPDFTGFSPSLQFTPSLANKLDKTLCTYNLPESESVLYDKRSCAMVWIRRDCSSYEIRTNNYYALQYAQRFIVHHIFKLIHSQQVAVLELPSNALCWANVYHNMQQHKQQQWFYQKQGKSHNQFQARKNKKRQRLRSVV